MKKLPLIAKCDKDGDIFKCPNLGKHIPKGWKMVNEFFVDSSGFGTESETALTPSQFLTKVKKGCGYGIVEEGQFQLYVGEFVIE